jgi:hypothetical protein
MNTADKGDEHLSHPPDLATFVDDWNGLQGLTTPDHHRQIVGWLDAAIAGGQRHLLLMAFRGAGKSSVIGLFAAWLLLTDPNRRVMVIAADLRLARKMVRNVQRIIERHPATEGLKPAGRAQWAADEFTVVRDQELRDPSMLARSVSANFTGSRADVIICDDVEVPRTCDTAPKRADLREKLGEIDYVLVPGGMQLYVGTPHSYYSIYAAELREEAGETQPFLDGFARKILPVWDDDHVPAWPERFDIAHIERIRKRSGPSRFAAHMLLQPVNQTAGRLDLERLRHYPHEPVYHEAQGVGVLTLGGVRMVSASCWWDPAFVRPADDGAAGDASVVAVVFAGADNNFYLHRVLYLTVGPGDPTTEGRQQCRAVVALMRELNLPSIRVETNGLGTFLPGLLREELRRAGVWASVVAERSTRPKAQRIVEAFEAPLADGRIFAHRSVWDTAFVREMREWRPGRNRVHDDGLDAAAGALTCEPWRFDRPLLGDARPRPADWRPGPVVAPAEWTV